MSSLFRKFRWWTEWRRREDDLRQELQFHLEEETQERRADGLSEDQARWAAHRDLGNLTLLRSEEHTSELQSHSDLVCRLLLEKKNPDTATFASPHSVKG